MLWFEQDPYKTLYAQLHQVTRRAKVIVDPGIERYDKRTDTTRPGPNRLSNG